MIKVDYLIIGSGVAGLRAAIELAKSGDVLIVTKDRAYESSSSYAQGGIAVVIGQDDTPEYHMEDTTRAGCGLSKKRAVKVLVEDGPPRVRELVEWGARFDMDNGELQIGLEGAHSRRRILHFRDATGEEIVRVLREKALGDRRIRKISKQYVVDLIVKNGRCEGAILLNEEDGDIYHILAGATILATGGAGQLYLRTSNPAGATGDGIAMAYRAGATVVDMEFVQFHPTAFAMAGAPSFLITEALRGEGALLRNIDGIRFMPHYHPMAELAPRDEVSRAIIKEIIKTGADFVYLDATMIDPDVIKTRFPVAYSSCLKFNIDITKDLIPVSPAAHFIIGGVETDTWGRTSIEGLFAAGEVACTGVHGANRLASNSLLEGLVFGARTGIGAAEYLRKNRRKHGSIRHVKDRASGHGPSSVRRLKDAIKKTMWNHAGIIRSGDGLKRAIDDLCTISDKISDHGYTRGELEVINMVTTARLIARAALMRKESIGAHFREDYPHPRKRSIHRKLNINGMTD